jgi:hypothetical protein
MDGSRFDAWTRRRFGLTAGGFAASLFALTAIDAEAKKKDKKKKKKKKKRCKGLTETCTPGGTRKCCDKRRCGRALTSTEPNRCCETGGVACSAATATQCCTGICDETSNLCFCKGAGQACDSDSQCCSNTCANLQCT